MKPYDINFIKDQFPALQRKVWDKKLVYLDSAASMQKPKRVLDAIVKVIPLIILMFTEVFTSCLKKQQLTMKVQE